MGLILPVAAILARRRIQAPPPPPPAGDPYGFLRRMLAATNGNYEIVWVTNRNANGSGSLKAACEGGSSNVTRIVLFAVNGVIDLGNRATHSNTIYKEAIGIGRSNIWVAGQSCPAGTGSNGRGVKVLGRINCLGSNIVIQHIRVQPVVGDNDPRQSLVSEGLKHAATKINNTAHRGVVFQNCSVHAATDEAIAIDPKVELGSTVENIIIADCFVSGCRHYGLSEVLYHGANPDDIRLAGGAGGYGPMLGVQSTKFLFLRNLVTSATFRSPQIGTWASGLVINNYIFNYGVNYDDNEGRAGERKTCPISTDFKEKSGWPKPAIRYARIGFDGNYAEAGCRSNPWQWDGEFLRVRSSQSGGCRWWDGEGNKIVTYYARAGLTETSSGGNRVSAKNTQLRGTIQEEWAYPQTRPTYGTELSNPPFSLPQVVLTADQAKAAALTSSGAWPIDRCSVDALMLSEVIAKTHDIYPGIPMPNGERYAAANIPDIGNNGPTYPDDLPADPGAVEGNGLHAIENWLHARHVAAGGYNDYSVQEWFDRE